jgi:hypothetical protein
MRFLVSLITAVAFLAHATFGCCAHHQHESAEACIHHEASCLDQEAADHSHESSDSAPEDSSCPGHQCNGSQCVFISNGKTVMPKLTVAALLSICRTPFLTLSCDSLSTAVVDSGGLFDPHLRLHLLNQVLLI